MPEDNNLVDDLMDLVGFVEEDLLADFSNESPNYMAPQLQQLFLLIENVDNVLNHLTGKFILEIVN